VLHAAYCPSDDSADDKDGDNDNRGDTPSRAVPRGLLRDATTVLQLPFLMRKGNGSGAVATRGSGSPVWRIGRSAIMAFIQQIDVIVPLSNRKGRGTEYGYGGRDGTGR
jgi:hypothetical protein